MSEKDDPNHVIWQAALHRLDRQRGTFDRLYFYEGLSRKLVAARMGFTEKTLENWIESRKIRRRTQQEAQKARAARKSRADDIIMMRLNKRISAEEIDGALEFVSREEIDQILEREDLAGPVGNLPSLEEYLQRKQRKKGQP